MKGSAVKIALLCLLSLFPSPLSSATDAFRVAGVSVRGNFTFSSSRLLPLISLRPPSWRQRLFRKAELPFFSMPILENDLHQIVRFYQREGFIDAAAEVGELQFNEKRKTVTVTIDVIEGLPIVVETVVLQLDSLAGDSLVAQRLIARAMTVLELQAGRRFRDEALYRDRDRLLQFFGDEGFPYARLVHHLSVDRPAHRASITYHIDPGPACIFGRVVTERAPHTEKLVLRQLTFREGTPFNRKALDQTQRRLYDMSLFEFVTVKALLPQPPQREIPVEIHVRPAPRTTVKVGVGYGREEEMRGFVSLQRLSFWGGARRLDLLAKHSKLEPYMFDLRLIQPAFLRPTASLGINPFMRRQVEPAFHISRNGVNLFVQQSIGLSSTVGATYTFEQVDVDLGSLAERRVTEELRGLYNKSSLLLAASRNTTDDLFAPTTGSRLNLSVKYSGLGAGEYHFTKWLIDLRRYSKQKNTVTAMRLSVGKIDSFDPSNVVPIEDLFFSGGANSVRGWGRHELGPRDAEGKPLGGAALFEGSLELRRPLYRSFHSVLFLDAGNVFVERLNLMESRFAVGAGLRFKTPVGPVRLDLAQPIFEPHGSLRWHFTVGEAF